METKPSEIEFKNGLDHALELYKEGEIAGVLLTLPRTSGRYFDGIRGIGCEGEGGWGGCNILDKESTVPPSPQYLQV